MYLDRGETYRAIGLLGKGAFAEVYLAEDRAGRLYACKVCGHPELPEREAGIHRGVSHPLFPAFFDFWREEGRGYILMEYVRGESLGGVLRRRGKLREEEAAELGIRLAEGLGYLHGREAPLVFRDVKPENVMLAAEGGVRLLDFGCACAPGRAADRAGTPGFGAPEQFAPGEIQGKAADVYGLGRTLQAAVGGKSGGLFKRITDKCTALDPEERLPGMREAAELLLLCTDRGRGRMSLRQRGILEGRIRVVKEIIE